MKKANLLLVAFLTLTMVVMAGNDKLPKAESSSTILTGLVLDKVTGEALAGVKVELINCNQDVYTDFDGNFKFENVKCGTHTIKTNLISYKVNNVEVECTGSDNNIEIPLENK